MKSPEQMGKLPEQPKEELMKNKEKKERQITTPEQAAQKTLLRRIMYGLGEATELTLEETEEIDKSIGELLERLNKYDYNSFSPEIQDRWYWVEQEANVGKDREIAKFVLEKFLSTLEGKVE